MKFKSLSGLGRQNSLGINPYFDRVAFCLRNYFPWQTVSVAQWWYCFQELTSTLSQRTVEEI